MDILTEHDAIAAAIIYWYQQSKISQENAAEMASLTRRDFLAALAREKCDVFVVYFEDLKEELARGSKKLGFLEIV